MTTSSNVPAGRKNRRLRFKFKIRKRKNCGEMCRFISSSRRPTRAARRVPFTFGGWLLMRLVRMRHFASLNKKKRKEKISVKKKKRAKCGADFVRRPLKRSPTQKEWNARNEVGSSRWILRRITGCVTCIHGA